MFLFADILCNFKRINQYLQHYQILRRSNIERKFVKIIISKR